MSKEIVVPCDGWSLWQMVDNNNWKKQFPYCPKTAFRMAHDDNALKIEFDVTEKYTKALVKIDNDKVWFDSCVELFISFDQTGYYNFEFNCIGTMLLGFRKTKPNATHADNETLKLIKRTSSYPRECFDEIIGENKWTLNVEIPKEAFFAHKFKSLNGLEATANVYKCGDGVKEMHFLSWNKIETEDPNFHVPQFFGKLHFQ